MDHLLHMFHHGHIYFIILMVRFTQSLCYCGTPSTHDFSSSSNFISSLFLSLYLSIFALFQIFSKSTSSSFLHHLHHIFIFHSSSSSIYSYFSFFIYLYSLSFRFLLNQREFDEPLPPSLPLPRGKGGATRNQGFGSPLRVGEGSENPNFSLLFPFPVGEVHRTHVGLEMT